MKRRVLFVDDEPRVLQGLQRMLRSMRNEWEMSFAEGGHKALDMMAENPFDIVVSDMRMPGMDGAELLKHVMEKYPQTIRIVLSGHSDREMILKSVRTAHQYLSKPCDAETLKATVGRASSLRELLASEKIKQLVSKIDSLPSLPDLYMKMMDELQKSDSSVKKVGDIIQQDIGMSAKILQLVNSAFFGLPRQISDASQAVSLLGLETVKALVLSVHVFSEFPQTKMEGFSPNTLWKHSLTVGNFAKQIFQEESNDSNFIGYALTAGLLHDVGKLVLVTSFPDVYEKIIAATVRENALLSDWEQEMLGANHGEVGAYLMGLWGLPDLVVEAVAYHHNPSYSQTGQFSPLTAVHVANVFDHEIYEKRLTGKSTEIDKSYIGQFSLLERLGDWKKSCSALIEAEV